MKAKVIKRKNQALLVEYTNENSIQRRIIVSALTNESAGDVIDLSDEEIDAAIPYGIQWDYELEDVTISATNIERALIHHGIWTVDDFGKNPSAVLGAVHEAATPILILINQIVKEYGGKP